MGSISSNIVRTLPDDELNESIWEPFKPYAYDFNRIYNGFTAAATLGTYLLTPERYHASELLLGAGIYTIQALLPRDAGKYAHLGAYLLNTFGTCMLFDHFMNGTSSLAPFLQADLAVIYMINFNVDFYCAANPIASHIKQEVHDE